MTPERSSGRDGREARGQSATQTTNRFTRRPPPPPQADFALKPMRARMQGNKLVRPPFAAGKLTTGDRLRQTTHYMRTERKAKEDILKRRTATGLGPTALEKFSQLSDGLIKDKKSAPRPERPVARARRRSSQGLRRTAAIDDDDSLHIVRPAGNRHTKELNIASGYNTLSSTRPVSPPPRGKKRNSEGRFVPLSRKRQRQGGKENIPTDVIEVVESSDDDQPREKKFSLSLSKKPKPKPNPKSKRPRQTTSALIAIPVLDPVFGPLVDRSPLGSGKLKPKQKARRSVDTGRASHNVATSSVEEIVRERVRSSSDGDQTDNSVELISDQEVSFLGSAKTDGETSPTDPRKSKLHRELEHSVFDRTPTKRGKIDIAHGRTSPLVSQRKGTSEHEGTLPARRKLFQDRTAPGATALPTSPDPRPVRNPPSPIAGREMRESGTKITIDFRPIPAFPANLDDDGNNFEVEEILDGSDEHEDIVPSKTKHRKAKNTRNGSISPSTFYPKTRAQSRNLTLTSNSGSSKSKKRIQRPKRPRRSKRAPIACSDDEMESGDVRLRDLSKAELKAVDTITKAPKNRVVAKIEEANIELRGEDFSRLRACRWLSDELINSFIALINARNSTYSAYAECPDVTSDVIALTSKLRISGRCDSGSALRLQSTKASTDAKSEPKEEADFFARQRPRVHIFNTFFFTRLTQGDGFDYQGVKRWLKRTGKSVSELDLIMFPININNLHWVLAAIDLRGKMFLYFDSTFGSDTLNAVGLLRRWLKDEVLDKCGEEMLHEMDIASWKSDINPSYTPQQDDYGSCGIFALYTAEYLERGVRPNFTQDHVRVLRRRTALFLKDGKLPE